MFNPHRYRKVKGDPAFPPVSLAREEAYIERMIKRDKELGQSPADYAPTRSSNNAPAKDSHENEAEQPPSR